MSGGVREHGPPECRSVRRGNWKSARASSPPPLPPCRRPAPPPRTWVVAHPGSRSPAEREAPRSLPPLGSGRRLRMHPFRCSLFAVRVLPCPLVWGRRGLLSPLFSGLAPALLLASHRRLERKLLMTPRPVSSARNPGRRLDLPPASPSSSCFLVFSMLVLRHSSHEARVLFPDRGSGRHRGQCAAYRLCLRRCPAVAACVT